jgi:hypothetical protein
LNNFRKWHDADETIDVFGAERCLFGSRLGEQVARAALHDYGGKNLPAQLIGSR